MAIVRSAASSVTEETLEESSQSWKHLSGHSPLRHDLLVRLPLIIRSAAVVVGNQQKLLVIIFVDILPSLQCIIVRLLRLERQGHGAIIAFAVDCRGEALEPLHENNWQPGRRVEGHVG